MSALNDKIKEINTLYAKAMSLLASNRQKLLALQPRLRTQEQRDRFQKLVGAQKEHENIFRSKIEPTMQKLRKAVTATKKVVSKVKQAGAAVKQKFVSTVKNVWDRVRSKVGLKGLRAIEDVDDLGVAPLVAAGLIAAGLFTALGYLVSLAQSQAESIDALNQYIEEQTQAQAAAEEETYEDEYTETGTEEEF